MTQQGNILTSNTNLSNIESNFALVASEIKQLKSATQPTATTNAISSLTTRVSNLESIPVTTLSTSGTVALADNSINTITPTAAVTFTLPTVTDSTVFHQILVQINMSTVYTVTLGTSYYFNQKAPDMSSVGKYNLFYEYDNALSSWVVGCVSKGAAS